MGTVLVTAVVLLAAGQAIASDTFADREDGAKVHGSGFKCPQKIGDFERDAVGEADPEAKSDFCAYSAVGGVYGTIKLGPLSGSFDPKQALAADFALQEATGGKRLTEKMVGLNGSSVRIYTRTYNTAQAESLGYRILFAGAAVNGWAVEATVEYADPRDVDAEAGFLRAVYATALRQIGR